MSAGSTLGNIVRDLVQNTGLGSNIDGEFYSIDLQDAFLTVYLSDSHPVCLLY